MNPQPAEPGGVAAGATSIVTAAPATSWRASARQIAPLAWPVFIGQISVVAFGTIDTLLVARQSAADLAALAVGAAAYITVFIGLMGVVIAVAPISGQLFGARKIVAAGHQLHQAVWLALGAEPAGQHGAGLPATVSGPVAGHAGGGRQGARLSAGTGICAAGVVDVFGVPRLQHRGVDGRRR